MWKTSNGKGEDKLTYKYKVLFEKTIPGFFYVESEDPPQITLPCFEIRNVTYADEYLDDDMGTYRGTGFELIEDEHKTETSEEPTTV